MAPMATMAQIEDLDKQQRPIHAACIMPPAQRAQAALQAAAEAPVAALARDLGVSRKFVTGLRHRAQTALDEAFQPEALNDDRVLFHLPVTAAWLEQLVLALLLECRSSYRGVMALFETCLSHISLGKLNDLIHSTAKTAEMLPPTATARFMGRPAPSSTYW